MGTATGSPVVPATPPPGLLVKGNGVPTALDALATRIAYGDSEAAETLFAQRGDQIAAVLTVPYDWGDPMSPPPSSGVCAR